MVDLVWPSSKSGLWWFFSSAVAPLFFFSCWTAMVAGGWRISKWWASVLEGTWGNRVLQIFGVHPRLLLSDRLKVLAGSGSEP
jgi:hypothetical protein